MPSWAGLWDNVFAQPYAPLNEPNSTLRGIARLMAPQALKGQAAVGAALTGQAVGQTASAGVAQVTARQADGMNMGGAVPISTTSQVNRPTTAADETLLDAQFNPTFAPATYPPDKSGNGGGSKAGTIN